MSSLAKVQKTRDIKKPIDIKVARLFHKLVAESAAVNA